MGTGLSLIGWARLPGHSGRRATATWSLAAVGNGPLAFGFPVAGGGAAVAGWLEGGRAGVFVRKLHATPVEREIISMVR